MKQMIMIGINQTDALVIPILYKAAPFSPMSLRTRCANSLEAWGYRNKAYPLPAKLSASLYRNGITSLCIV